MTREKDSLKLSIEGVIKGRVKTSRTIIIEDVTNIDDIIEVLKVVAYFFREMTFAPGTIRDALSDVAREIGEQVADWEDDV